MNNNFVNDNLKIQSELIDQFNSDRLNKIKVKTYLSYRYNGKGNKSFEEIKQLLEKDNLMDYVFETTFIDGSKMFNIKF